jgi:hypothetical protein
MSKAICRILFCLALFLVVCAGLVTGAFAQYLAPNSIQVSRVQYDGNTGTYVNNFYISPYGFPEIFNDPAGLTTGNDIQDITGIQGSIYVDQFSSVPASSTENTLSLPSNGEPAAYPTVEPGSYITTSFSSKSEGALTLSLDGTSLTYMGYEGGDQLDNVSNSYSPNPNYELSPNSYTADPNTGTPINITAATDTSKGNATITLSSPVSVPSGAYFTIAGMSTSGYNGTFATSAAASNSTTVTLSGLPDSLASCNGSGTPCGGTATYDPPYPFYDREVALMNSTGLVSLTPIDNTNSGDNPRAALTLDENEFYIVGNSDSTTASPSSGPNNPGLTIGSRCGAPLNNISYQFGTYTAADRPDESAKKHVKDNNWRGVGVYTDGNGNQQLYVSKGSGSNGDDGLFQVGTSLPACSAALIEANGTNYNAGITITELPGLAFPVTNQTTGAATPILPFGFWFANPTTLYVADEGNPPSYTGGSSPSFSNSTNGTYVPSNDPYAGLEKWSLVNGTWTLDYTIQAGLNFNLPQTFNGYNDINGDALQSYTYGLRNMTGVNNNDGTVTIYAVTAQFSAVSGGEPDPTSLVGITDSLAATSLPANEQFVTLQTSASGELYRGVAYVPPAPGTQRQTQTITFPNPGPVTYGVAPITLSASATSGWPIAYTVVSGPATVLGNVLTITGAGSVVVEADQSGNTDYAAAASVQDTITVAQASQTISFTVNAPTQAVYGTSFTVAASASSQLPATYASAGSCSNNGAYYTMTSGTGSCTVTASQSGNGNYQAASPVSESTTAIRANPTVTFTGAPATAPMGSSFTLVATTNASGSAVITVGGTVCSLSGEYSPDTATVLKDAGTCKFTATWGADPNYNPAIATQATTATKIPPVITWETPASITYGTPLSATQLNATANVSGAFTYKPVSGTLENAGSDTLTAKFVPTSSDYQNATATVTLQVLQAATTTEITSATREVVYLNKAGLATAVVDVNVTSFEPKGTVSVIASTGEACSGTVSPATGDGGCKLEFSTTGSRTVTASYSGDGNHLPSNSSNQVTVVVNPY